MTSPLEANFEAYKVAEAKSLELLREMRSVSARPVDIELALLVSIFELHKGSLPVEQIISIIQGHLRTLRGYYTPPASQVEGE